MNVLMLFAGSGRVPYDGPGYASVYYIIAGLNAYAATMIIFVPRTSPDIRHKENIISAIREGFKYIRLDTTILFVLGFTLLVTVLSMPYHQLLPIYAEDILKVGASGQGILMSVSGIGALIGSFILASMPNKIAGLCFFLVV